MPISLPTPTRCSRRDRRNRALDRVPDRPQELRFDHGRRAVVGDRFDARREQASAIVHPDRREPPQRGIEGVERAGVSLRQRSGGPAQRGDRRVEGAAGRGRIAMARPGERREHEPDGVGSLFDPFTRGRPRPAHEAGFDVPLVMAGIAVAPAGTYEFLGLTFGAKDAEDVWANWKLTKGLWFRKRLYVKIINI